MIDRARWAEKRLAYRFNNSSLLEQALTHRSAAKNNYERLEFLGDALLNFTVARELYHLRSEDSEGDLSRARAALVNKSVLAEIGRDLGIQEQLILGRGELRTGGAQRSSTLADAVEALIGAVFLDGGYSAAEGLIRELLAERFESLPDASELKDAKTKLQEWLQGHGIALPDYRVEAVEGREHEKVFSVVCSVEQKQLRTTGSGPSRRRAEQAAAAAMLAILTDDRGA